MPTKSLSPERQALEKEREERRAAIRRAIEIHHAVRVLLDEYYDCLTRATQGVYPEWEQAFVALRRHTEIGLKLAREEAHGI